MSPEPVPAEPEWDDDPAWSRPDPMTAEELEASLDRLCELDQPAEEEDEDFEPFTAEELAEISQAGASDLLAVEAATTGRRGPGQPGSARVFPGESSSPAASFGPGMALDVLPGCAGLAVAADAAAGDDGGFEGVSEGELIGIVCGWDRVEAHAAARKLAAIAEMARRNPGPLDAEFTADQLACALGESRAGAGDLLDLAGHLDTGLPGTQAALRDGTLSLRKAGLIAAATALLDPDEARAAEAKVLDRASRLTPAGLRAAIARAVIEVAPGTAKQRRETAAKFARVERWAEDTGNAALMGRELPPDQVLAADQKITAWAHEAEAGRAGGRDGRAPRPRLPRLAPRQRLPARPGGAEPAASPPPTPRPPARRAARFPPGSPAGSR